MFPCDLAKNFLESSLPHRQHGYFADSGKIRLLQCLSHKVVSRKCKTLNSKSNLNGNSKGGALHLYSTHCWWFRSSSSLRSTGLEKLYRASSATSKLDQWGQCSELCDLLLLFPQHLSLSYLLSLYQSRFWQGILDLQPNSCSQQVTNTKSMLLSKQLLPATREMPGVVFVPKFIFNYNLMMVALNKMKAHIPDMFFTE